ncbi:hypothetical protein PAHAL_1G371900 [Panicum hallii]|uniref:Uncharacterized protein n=1 Tax=Panicum hallii TaxID=206008 RepID=A0A2T8KXH9_9POAL|nr:hypothetical protein PAHAL_1G371900 [Panicum hallii]
MRNKRASSRIIRANLHRKASREPAAPEPPWRVGPRFWPGGAHQPTSARRGGKSGPPYTWSALFRWLPAGRDPDRAAAGAGRPWRASDALRDPWEVGILVGPRAIRPLLFSPAPKQTPRIIPSENSERLMVIGTPR